jgi:aldehyde:ferredoxin oxidoreductase
MRVVFIDLTTSHVTDTISDELTIAQFVGGRGIGTKLLFSHAPPGADPLSPSYPIVFSTGPLTGTPFPMSGRFEATTKSPLSGTVSTSSCGGRFGVSLKRAGVDALVVTGAAAEPSYVSIGPDSIEIKPATHLWAKEKMAVKKTLKQKHGPGTSILLIGKAGENRVPFANIENDGRYLGRGGLGAILGAKHLKAIVSKGSGRIEAADRETFSFLRYECRKWLSANPITSKGLPEFGTAILLNYMREVGLLREKNFRFPASFESSLLSGESLSSMMLKKRRACPFCPVACGRVTTEGDGPEYETLWALGVNLALFDLEKVVHLNYLCNELGLDTVSTGATIGMALELQESGKLSVDASYGDFDGIKRLIVDIAERNGSGELLSLGTAKLGDECNAREIAPHVKGLELPAYDPRGAYGHALGYATSNRGGCHMQGYMIGPEVLGIPKKIDRYTVQGKASILALYQNIAAFMDTLVMCRFSSFALPHDYYARIASAATGKKITWEDSIRTGERLWNLERLFNLREGVEPDRLPGRFGNIPLKEMLAEYYAVRGWDETGKPKPETLNILNLL